MKAPSSRMSSRTASMGCKPTPSSVLPPPSKTKTSHDRAFLKQHPGCRRATQLCIQHSDWEVLACV
eukprot:5423329-Alexandrium_andersonii.AAC.1